MTRALWWAARFFGAIAVIAFVMLWRELFVAAAVIAMLSIITWGFLEPAGGER